MIKNLRIQNVALIEEVEVNFAAGLNILSGETGAGKSILVDSIGFLLGGRAMREFIRAGADFASVEGVLECPAFAKEGLTALGIETVDNELLLSRTMTAENGKSVCRVNGRTVTVGVLKDAAELLVDLHGQHEHQSLLDAGKQLIMLDAYCGEGLVALKSELEGLLSRYKEVARELKKLTGEASPEQVEMWRFQLNEIESAALKADEEEGLTAKRNRLAGLERLSKNTDGIVGLLSTGFFEGRGNTSAVDQVARAVAFSAEIADIDPTKQPLHAALVDVQALLEEVSRDFRAYSDELDADPNELDKLETRLDTIYRLKKKYGGDIAAVIKKGADLAAALDSLENRGVQIAEAEMRRKAISKEISALCGKMNALRVEGGQKISAAITEILRDLGMQNARFFVAVTSKTTFGPDGNDEVEFMISPNPGEPEKPLRRIASGGEMSRIMLAIKTIMTDRISTVIFDEVDTGVSGRTAQQVAEKLAAVSATRQILCITHLPQIAAMADTHFLIQKTARENRTVTSVTPLNPDEITQELARLTGGAAITEATLRAAREMKAQATEIKRAGHRWECLAYDKRNP